MKKKLLTKLKEKKIDIIEHLIRGSRISGYFIWLWSCLLRLYKENSNEQSLYSRPKLNSLFCFVARKLSSFMFLFLYV